jgi:hypothetical protein
MPDTEVQLRLYVARTESWSWDSRNDCWVLAVYDSPEVLQVRASGIWVDIPHVIETTKGAGPIPEYLYADGFS